MTRRQFLGLSLVALASLPAYASLPLSVPEGHSPSPQVPLSSQFRLVARDGWQVPSDPLYETELARATYGFLKERFGTSKKLGIWQRPFTQIGLKRRVEMVAPLAVRAARELEGGTIDPAWIMAQMWEEANFYEFAVSGATAVGPCQFIRATAEEEGLHCAGSVPAHSRAPYARAESLVGQEVYWTLRDERDALPDLQETLSLDDALAALVSDEIALDVRRVAKTQFARVQQLKELNGKMSAAGRAFKRYMQANLAGRDIFDPTDREWLVQFDERVLYDRVVPVMVRHMAGLLSEKKGNILSAAATYNAGPKWTSAVWSEYGRIPAITETVDYLSRITRTYHEIATRMK